MKNKLHGFTIIELMVSLAILIIAMHFTVSSMKELVLRQRVTTQINSFSGMQRMARQSAIFRQSIVTMCPSRDGITCLKRKYWHEGVLIFVDINADRVVDEKDHIVKFYKTENIDIQITWRAYQNKSYLQFTPNGWTNNQNGTFRFCIANESARYNRALIISRSGRIRLSTDSNDDGVHEDRKGENVSC
jgi:type IV fimbrial biogenesis protein FimT